MVHPHGQRTEIVHAGNPDLPGVHSFQDPRHEDSPACRGSTRRGRIQVRGSPAASPGRRCAGVNSSRWKRNTWDFGRDSWKSPGAMRVPSRHRPGTPTLLRGLPGAGDPSAPGDKGHAASQVGVAGGQHRGKPGRFLLAPPPFARLLKMPVASDNLQGALAVDLLFQSPQCLFHGLAFFKLNLGQTLSLPLQRIRESAATMTTDSCLNRGQTAYFQGQKCQSPTKSSACVPAGIMAHRLAWDCPRHQLL